MEKLGLKKLLNIYLERNNMDPYKWIKQSFVRVFILAAVITGLIGLLIGKVVEASIYLEIGKWIVLAIVAGFSACILFAPIIGMLDPIRDKMFPEYGKKWWIKWIKNGFKSE